MMLIGVVIVFLVCQMPQALQHIYVVYLGESITLEVNPLPLNSDPCLPCRAIIPVHFSLQMRGVETKAVFASFCFMAD